MHNLLEHINSYRSYKNFDRDLIIETLVKFIPEDHEEELLECLHGKITDGHYNDLFANKAVKKMFYMTNDKQVFGPFVTEEQAKVSYEKIKRILKDVNFWDYYVALNMIISDNHELLHKWFGDVDLMPKYEDLCTNWFMDGDAPYGSGKIWNYLNYGSTIG